MRPLEKHFFVLLLIPTRLVSTIGGKQDTYEYR